MPAQQLARAHGTCCVRDRCRDAGCHVGKPSRATVTCISGTLYAENHAHDGKLCDCLIVWQRPGEGVNARAVELKGGQVRTRAALEQLQAGANVLDGLLAAFDEVYFQPVLAARRGGTIDLKILQASRIAFRQERRLVKRVDCGARLD